MKQGKVLYKHDDSIKQTDTNIGSVLLNYNSDNNQNTLLMLWKNLRKKFSNDKKSEALEKDRQGNFP